jgi:hypothetical protein
MAALVLRSTSSAFAADDGAWSISKGIRRCRDRHRRRAALRGRDTLSRRCDQGDAFSVTVNGGDLGRTLVNGS